ncbi:MAG: RluA family pseudouridine synthase [Clostridioides sp.]|nr:RluA family pseudouridine synthase [Clostridioides sp.]
MFKKELQRYDKMTIEIDEEVNLKRFLLDELNFSVRSLSKMKKNRTITVNGEFKKFNAILKKGDLVQVVIDEEKGHFEAQDLNVGILYDDFDLIAVDKPPYMVVHPTKSHVDGTVANAVAHYIDKIGENVKIRFVNRLDMNTSGLVIVAKNAYAHHVLSEDMKYDRIEKKYIAVVDGDVKDDDGIIDAPIYRPEGDTIKRVVDERGQESITTYKVVERLNGATVLEVGLKTGRTHQIRVHMAHIGHGIIGDELYGVVDEELINRQALHAYKLSLLQPRTKEKLNFKSEIPEDMKQLVEKLRTTK